MHRVLAYVAFVLLLFTANAAVGEPLVLATLGAYDATDQPISEIPLGGQFELRAYVEDLRPDTFPSGIFSAFLQVAFDPSRIAAMGPFEIDSFFNLIHVTQLESNSLIGGGVTSSIQPPGLGQHLLFTLPMQATSPGVVAFDPSIAPGVENEWLLYGIDVPLTPDQIQLAGTRLSILPEPSQIALSGMGSLALGLVGRSGRRKRRRAMVD